ncbi:NAD-dependent epimerase/dehydratase family protein [Blastococcus sp. CT_GayMR19]|uniref:NAD-dependent epimerase/dehydratase family protein n=1 Tax=Blastococcus sp. CT_GayMR19 TaxID=2559608 RepID=UPI001FD85E19|nr:NAD-dependent epimerase/dehydratase family protein [Blastococcus sp. CT_GayMR19]
MAAADPGTALPASHVQAAPRPTRDVHRVVVTGGAGFLGSHLCTRLVAEGVDVVCLDNLLTGSAANVGHLQGADGFRVIRREVTDFVHVPGPVDQFGIGGSGSGTGRSS